MSPIDCIDPQLLKLACPENNIMMLAGWADAIKQGCIKYGISDMLSIAALLAQAGAESAGLTVLSENLNYSTAQRIQEVFGHKRFPTLAAAASCIHNPEKLANIVYANRMGNGPPESGDGWAYRGFGPFQLTGADNQRAFGETVGLPLEKVPAYLRTTNGGAMSMCWYFKTRGLVNLAQTPGIEDETRAINGGLNGLADRQRRYDAVLAELKRRLGQ